ncbi:MAG: hypothetical protein IJV83_05590 [Clostridia bacterium]|nr:hypothetical protein [Clostridia bacterium]MBQ9714775.1 hypothetical protein [Clostridia bacterium]
MDKIKKYLPLVAAGLAALAVILGLACDAVVYGKDTMFETGQSGWETVFPAEVMAMIMVMPFLTFLLVIVGGIQSLKAYFDPENEKASYIATACFLVAGIFFFFFKLFFCNAADMSKDLKKEYDLGVGAIIGAICSLLAAVAAVLPIVMKKLKK